MVCLLLHLGRDVTRILGAKIVDIHQSCEVIDGYDAVDFFPAGSLSCVRIEQMVDYFTIPVERQPDV